MFEYSIEYCIKYLEHLYRRICVSPICPKLIAGSELYTYPEKRYSDGQLMCDLRLNNAC